jgi:hypothetical protein
VCLPAATGGGSGLHSLGLQRAALVAARKEARELTWHAKTSFFNNLNHVSLLSRACLGKLTDRFSQEETGGTLCNFPAPIIQSDSAAVLPAGAPSISIRQTSISGTPAASASVTKVWSAELRENGPSL